MAHYLIARYVMHENVLDYMRCGWLWRANINGFAVLMVWCCDCKCVEPK